ncbi:hypothetical protein U1Q18_014409 [Sarracenia purpurea var. burkii]
MNRNLRRRNSTNQFGVLINLDSDEHFPSLAGTKVSGEARAIFQKASSLCLVLLDMTRDQSLGSQGQRAILSTVKKLESDEKQAKGPPLDSTKLAKLEARILRLNKIKDSVARDVASHKQDYLRTGCNVEGARLVVDCNNAVEKDVSQQGPPVRFSPEKNEALSARDLSICGVAPSVLADKAESGDEGSGSEESDSDYEEEVTSEEVDSAGVASPDSGALMEKVKEADVEENAKDDDGLGEEDEAYFMEKKVAAGEK